MSPHASALDEGADPRARDAEGQTPAMRAARLGALGCLRLLAGAGASMDSRDGRGWSGAMLAVCGGHVECLRFLATQGADLGAWDRQGHWCALSLAELWDRPECAEFIREHLAGIAERDMERRELLDASDPAPARKAPPGFESKRLLFLRRRAQCLLFKLRRLERAARLGFETKLFPRARIAVF